MNGLKEIYTELAIILPEWADTFFQKNQIFLKDLNQFDH